MSLSKLTEFWNSLTYYDDPYNLLREIEEETLIEVQKIMRPHVNATKRSGGQEIAVVVESLLQIIADNGNSIQVLLSKNGDSAFQKKFFHNGIEGIRQFTEAAGTKSQDKKAAGYGFVFVIGGMITLVQEWLKNGMDMPAPAKMLAKFTREGLW